MYSLPLATVTFCVFFGICLLFRPLKQLFFLSNSAKKTVTKQKKKDPTPKMKRKQVEEEEAERLISCKVVEYLQPVMSKELLFKFPDNSAFDFDYTQSSIWSPLVPRNYSPMDLNLVTPRKIAFGFGSELDSKNSSRSGAKKLSSSIKKKKKKMMMKTMAIGTPAFNVSLSNLKIRKHKVKVSKFSPTPINTSCVPFVTKGWNKVLKAATKHFKKRKKKDPTAHVKLSSYLRDV